MWDENRGLLGKTKTEVDPAMIKLAQERQNNTRNKVKQGEIFFTVTTHRDWALCSGSTLMIDKLCFRSKIWCIALKKVQKSASTTLDGHMEVAFSKTVEIHSSKRFPHGTHRR